MRSFQEIFVNSHVILFLAPWRVLNVIQASLWTRTGIVSARRRKAEGISAFLRASVTANPQSSASSLRGTPAARL